MTHTSTFDVTSAADFLRVVVHPQYQDFIAENASRRHAILTTIVAYHMYEWVHQEKFTLQRFKAAYPTQPQLADTFELARNITNGAKHFIPTAQTRTQGGFSSGFSDALARPLVVQYPDGTETSVDIFLRQMVTFWTDQQASGAF